MVINMEIYVKSFGDIKIIQFNIEKGREKVWKLTAGEWMSDLRKQ